MVPGETEARLARESAERSGEIGWKLRRDIDRGRRDRMLEHESPCVKELPLQAEVAGGSVDRVSAHGEPDRLEVDADLVRPAGLEPHVEERVARIFSLTSNQVTASRGVGVSSERRVRSRRSRPIGASIRPGRPGVPRTRAA